MIKYLICTIKIWETSLQIIKIRQIHKNIIIDGSIHILIEPLKS